MLPSKFYITRYIFWLYAFSFVFIWIITLILAPYLLPEGIVAASKAYLDIIPRVILGGAMMSMGIFCNVTVIRDVGMILSTTVSSGVGVILGIITSIIEEGIPEKGIGLIILISIVYIVGAITSAYASYMRNIDRGIKNSRNTITLRILILMLMAAFLTNGWSIGVAAGTANGIPPILTCAYMATGSFISVLILSLFYFSYKKMWSTVLCLNEDKKPLIYGVICGACHYGGNLISIYSMPALTATISFLLGRTSSLWTIFWGMYYKEFAGISRKTKILLASSIGLFIVGTLLVAITK